MCAAMTAEILAKTFGGRRAGIPRSSRRNSSDSANIKPSMLSVYDGRECCGFVLARGKLGYEAFDPNDKSIGIFETQRRAANALLIKEGGP